jgi:hypothetical protein
VWPGVSSDGGIPLRRVDGPVFSLYFIVYICLP